MDLVSYVLAVEEVSKACASTGVIMSVNNSLVCEPIKSFGTEEQKKKFLEPLATGQQQPRVTEEGGDGKGRLGHRSRDRALNNPASVDDWAPKRAGSLFVFRLPCGRPNDGIP
jgi:hypothetical protein